MYCIVAYLFHIFVLSICKKSKVLKYENNCSFTFVGFPSDGFT
jgi:hypothetical protein